MVWFGVVFHVRGVHEDGNKVKMALSEEVKVELWGYVNSELSSALVWRHYVTVSRWNPRDNVPAWTIQTGRENNATFWTNV